MKSRRGIFAALLVVVVAAPMHVLAGPEDDAMYTLTVYDFAGQSTTVRAPYMTPVPVDSNFDGIYDRTVTVGGVPRTGSVLSANELRPVRSIVNPLWQAASDHVQSVLREGQRLTQHVPSWVWQAVPEVGELPAGVESLFIQSAPITPSNPHRAVTVGRFRPHGISVGIGVAAGFMQIGYEMSESYETFQIRAIRAHDPSGDTTTTVNIEAAGASAIGSIVLKTGFLTASTVDDARLTLGFAGAEQSRSALLTLRQAGSVTTATMRAPAQSVSAVLSRTTPGETFDFRITVPDFPDDVTFVHTPGAIRTLQVISPGISYMRVDGDIASSSDRSQLLAILRDLPPSVRVVISEAYGSALVQPESGSIGEVEVNLSRNEQLPAAPLSQYLPGISGRDYAAVRRWSDGRWMVGAKVRLLRGAEVRWKDGTNGDGLHVDLKHAGGPMVVRHDDFEKIRYTDVTIASVPSDVVVTVHGSAEPKVVRVAGSAVIGHIVGTIDERREWRALKFEAWNVPRDVTLRIFRDGSAFELIGSDAGIGTLELETKSPPTLSWEGLAKLGGGNGMAMVASGGAQKNEQRMIARIRGLRRATVNLKEGPANNGIRADLLHAGGAFVVRHDDYAALRFINVAFKDLPAQIDATVRARSEPKLIRVDGGATIGRIEGVIDDRNEWKASQFVAIDVPKLVTLNLAGDGKEFDLATVGGAIGELQFEMKSPPTAAWQGIGELGSSDGVLIRKNGGSYGPDGENRIIARVRSLTKLKWSESESRDNGSYRPACSYRSNTGELRFGVAVPGKPFLVDYRERLEGKDEYLVARLSELPEHATLVSRAISESCEVKPGEWKHGTRAIELDYDADRSVGSLSLDTNQGDGVYFNRIDVRRLPGEAYFCKAVDAYCYSYSDVPIKRGSMRYIANAQATVNVDICMKSAACPDRVLVRNLIMKNLITELNIDDGGNGPAYIDTRGPDTFAQPVYGDLEVWESGHKTVDFKVPSPGIAADARVVNFKNLMHQGSGTGSAKCPSAAYLGVYTGYYAWFNLKTDLCTSYW